MSENNFIILISIIKSTYPVISFPLYLFINRWMLWKIPLFVDTLKVIHLHIDYNNRAYSVIMYHVYQVDFLFISSGNMGIIYLVYALWVYISMVTVELFTLRYKRS